MRSGRACVAHRAASPAAPLTDDELAALREGEQDARRHSPPNELILIATPGFEDCADRAEHRWVVAELTMAFGCGEFTATGEPDRMPCGCAALWVVT